jgi:hypothetical protein
MKHIGIRMQLMGITFILIELSAFTLSLTISTGYLFIAFEKISTICELNKVVSD